MSRLLDETARRLAAADASPLTRAAALRLAGGAAVAIAASGALGPLLRSARADDYCFDRCVHDASENLRSNWDTERAVVLRGAVSGGSILGLLRGAAVDSVNWVADYYQERANCRLPNCGSPDRYPPPAPPTTAPPPPPGPCAQGCPCGNATCAAGSYCGTCDEPGPICCVFPDKEGRSPCCAS